MVDIDIFIEPLFSLLEIISDCFTLKQEHSFKKNTKRNGFWIFFSLSIGFKIVDMYFDGAVLQSTKHDINTLEDSLRLWTEDRYLPEANRCSRAWPLTNRIKIQKNICEYKEYYDMAYALLIIISICEVLSTIFVIGHGRNNVLTLRLMKFIALFRLLSNVIEDVGQSLIDVKILELKFGANGFRCFQCAMQHQVLDNSTQQLLLISPNSTSGVGDCFDAEPFTLSSEPDIMNNIITAVCSSMWTMASSPLPIFSMFMLYLGTLRPTIDTRSSPLFSMFMLYFGCLRTHVNTPIDLFLNTVKLRLYVVDFFLFIIGLMMGLRLQILTFALLLFNFVFPGVLADSDKFTIYIIIGFSVSCVLFFLELMIMIRITFHGCNYKDISINFASLSMNPIVGRLKAPKGWFLWTLLIILLSIIGIVLCFFEAKLGLTLILSCYVIVFVLFHVFFLFFSFQKESTTTKSKVFSLDTAVVVLK